MGNLTWIWHCRRSTINSKNQLGAKSIVKVSSSAWARSTIITVTSKKSSKVNHLTLISQSAMSDSWRCSSACRWTFTLWVKIIAKYLFRYYFWIFQNCPQEDLIKGQDCDDVMHWMQTCHRDAYSFREVASSVRKATWEFHIRISISTDIYFCKVQGSWTSE